MANVITIRDVDDSARYPLKAAAEITGMKLRVLQEAAKNGDLDAFHIYGNSKTWYVTGRALKKLITG